MKRLLLTLILCLLPAIAQAQSARVIQLPNGKYIALFVLPGGGVVYLDDVEVVKLPDAPAPISSVDRVTYVYEKDEGGVFPKARVAMIKMNAGKKIIATEFEDDTVDGDGQVPDQYKIALKAATDKPCLVYQSGDRVAKVLKVTKSTTIDEMLEATK